MPPADVFFRSGRSEIGSPIMKFEVAARTRKSEKKQHIATEEKYFCTQVCNEDYSHLKGGLCIYFLPKFPLICWKKKEIRKLPAIFWTIWWLVVIMVQKCMVITTWDLFMKNSSCILKRAFISGCLLFCTSFCLKARKHVLRAEISETSAFQKWHMAYNFDTSQAQGAQRAHICANERTFAQTRAHFKRAYKHLCLPQFGSSRKL